MKLMRSTGALQPPDPSQINEDALVVLVAEAERALRAGVALTFADWLELEPYERDAFVLAGDRLWAERAAASGLAAQGVDMAAVLASVADGGSLARQLDGAKKGQVDRGHLEDVVTRLSRAKGGGP